MQIIIVYELDSLVIHFLITLEGKWLKYTEKANCLLLNLTTAFVLFFPLKFMNYTFRTMIATVPNFCYQFLR